LTDRDLTLVRVGGAVEQTVGHARDLYVGRNLSDAIATEGAKTGALERHRQALAGATLRYDQEYRGRLLASVLTPARDTSGAIVGVIGTAFDVTTWRSLERRMVDAQRAESLGVLAGGLAHDFNNLLVAVLGNVDLALREIRPGQPGRDTVENIRTAGLRAAELTDQLMAYAGRAGTGTARVEPGLLLEELLRIVGPSIPENIQITVDIPDRLAVRGEPGQLRQVLLNLVNNARDALAGRAGHIRVRAEATHVDGNSHTDDVLTPTAGSHVLLEIFDDGPGVDGEARQRMFEPFFSTKDSGHGLGLAAVLGIVRAHGGGIRVVSSPGAGTKMQILWPAAVTAPIAAVTAPPASQTILVIDDEDLVRDVVARMVEELGYATVTARDGRDGLAMLEQHAVDAVLVDLSLPHMSGMDVIAAMRARRPDLPLIVCSGYDRDSRGPIAADAYLPKPFRIESLQRTLAKLLPLRNV
jgi:signal transduction histidine kinase/CheY-like chemotaxis protein